MLFNGQICYIKITTQWSHPNCKQLIFLTGGLLEVPEGEGYFTDTIQIREINSTVPCLLNKGSVE